ncbi:MAG: GAF domain-containing protein [Rhodospirillales bacterium]|nr:GAF domain-containing protein [Rhodospirillales bacterium]
MPRKSSPDRLSLFGARAAERPDVDEMLSLACQEVADAVNVHHVKVLEYLRDENALLLRAGVGWRPGVVGHVRLPAGLESAAGFTLQTGKPTIANDLATEQRFHVPKLLTDHGVRSAVNVLIKSRDYTFGVLEADSIEPRAFEQAEVDVLQGFANVLALVVVQSRLAEENYQLSERTELLFRELSHRTKNNNQMILSIVGLQKSKAEILEVSVALDDVLKRIYVLNSIDDFLTSANDSERIDVASYLGAVAGKVFSTYSDATNKVRLKTDLADGSLHRSHAQGLAIIVNEFITNSFKHAFTDSGVVSLKMSFDAGTATFEISDDGPGIPADASPGLGLQIIDAITQQIDGRMSWPKGKGTRLRIRLPHEPG